MDLNLNKKVSIPANSSVTNKLTQNIDLGYMSIVHGEWETDNDDPLDPNEIVIPQCSIDIIYRYPFTGIYPFTHTTTHPQGFSRKEISEQIMHRYAQMYREEEEDAGNPGNITGMFNRQTTAGRYGVWGHDIGDLMLYSISIDRTNKDQYTIGIDS